MPLYIRETIFLLINSNSLSMVTIFCCLEHQAKRFVLRDFSPLCAANRMVCCSELHM